MRVNSHVGESIRAARKRNALSQKELAEKLETTQATISNWETAKQEPDSSAREKLQTVLGEGIFAADARAVAGDTSVLATWLSKTMERAGLTVSQLAEKSGLSMMTIYNIQAGRARNPRPRTIELLEKAVQTKFETEFREEVERDSKIEGVGEFRDFDPHDSKDWPSEPGVYVFYDISDRPSTSECPAI